MGAGGVGDIMSELSRWDHPGGLDEPRLRMTAEPDRVVVGLHFAQWRSAMDTLASLSFERAWGLMFDEEHGPGDADVRALTTEAIVRVMHRGQAVRDAAVLRAGMKVVAERSGEPADVDAASSEPRALLVALMLAARGAR